MITGLIIVAMALPGAAIVFAIYLMRHYDSRAARGIADAGAMYNELYGLGRPPRFVQVEELPDPPELPEPPSFPTAQGPDGPPEWPNLPRLDQW